MEPTRCTEEAYSPMLSKLPLSSFQPPPPPWPPPPLGWASTDAQADELIQTWRIIISVSHETAQLQQLFDKQQIPLRNGMKLRAIIPYCSHQAEWKQKISHEINMSAGCNCLYSFHFILSRLSEHSILHKIHMITGFVRIHVPAANSCMSAWGFYYTTYSLQNSSCHVWIMIIT